jgi:hypothetical protein
MIYDTSNVALPHILQPIARFPLVRLETGSTFIPLVTWQLHSDQLAFAPSNLWANGANPGMRFGFRFGSLVPMLTDRCSRKTSQLRHQQSRCAPGWVKSASSPGK